MYFLFLILVFIVGISFLYAAITDCLCLVIKNTTCSIIALVGLLRGFLPYPYGWIHHPTGFLWAMGGDFLMALAVFCFFFIFWLLRGMGAGDVKFAAAGAIWFGIDFTLQFVSSFALLGAMMGVSLFGIRMIPALRDRLVSLAPWLTKKGQLYFPYGPAIAAGAIWTLYQQVLVLGAGG